MNQIIRKSVKFEIKRVINVQTSAH